MYLDCLEAFAPTDLTQINWVGGIRPEYVAKSSPKIHKPAAAFVFKFSVFVRNPFLYV